MPITTTFVNSPINGRFITKDIDNSFVIKNSKFNCDNDYRSNYNNRQKIEVSGSNNFFAAPLSTNSTSSPPHYGDNQFGPGVPQGSSQPNGPTNFPHQTPMNPTPNATPYGQGFDAPFDPSVFAAPTRPYGVPSTDPPSSPPPSSPASHMSGSTESRSRAGTPSPPDASDAGTASLSPSNSSNPFRNGIYERFLKKLRYQRRPRIPQPE
ncbi:hypothetical protein ONZ45_g14957 [Pleurotus djamor]|nr:hypothetical protein ONZ45_g14957 [Pleurotus djamor]